MIYEWLMSIFVAENQSMNACPGSRMNEMATCRQ